MKLSKERENLIVENQKLVYYFVSKFGVVPDSEYWKELVSVGNMGLVQAAIAFDESMNVKFDSFAGTCIKNEIQKYLNSERKYANEISWEQPIADNGKGSTLVIGDTIYDSRANFVEKIMNKEHLVRVVNIVLNCFKKKQKLIALYRIGNVTQQEIANKFCVSNRYISKVEKYIIQKLKDFLKEESKYKRRFFMSFQDTTYTITFSSNEVKKFNQIFAMFLRSLPLSKNLLDFKVECDSNSIRIAVPADRESFALIADIIKAIDEFKEKNVTDNEVKEFHDPLFYEVMQEYKITFTTESVDFNNILYKKLLDKRLSDLKISNNKGWTILRGYASQETVEFISELIQQTDTFSMKFAFDKSKWPKREVVLQEILEKNNKY